MKKQMFNPKKADIEEQKADIERLLSEKGCNFSAKTIVYVHEIFGKFGYDGIFGRSAIMELLDLKSSGTSRLLSNLLHMDIIEPVSGHGKGKYKFKR